MTDIVYKRLPVTPRELEAQHPDEKRLSDKYRQFWGYLAIRPLSFYIAPFCVYLGLSALQITLLGFTILIIAIAILLITSKFALIILAAVLVNIWYVLDFTDGVVARFEGQESNLGAFLDWLVGQFMLLSLPMCVAYLLFKDPQFALVIDQKKSLSFWILFAYLFSSSQLLTRYVGERLNGGGVDSGHPHSGEPSAIRRFAFSISSFVTPTFLLFTVLMALDIWLILYSIYYFVGLSGILAISIKKLA